MPINIDSRYRGLNDVSMRHSDTVVGVVIDGQVTPYKVRGISGSDREPELILRKMKDRHHGRHELVLSINDPSLILDRPDCGMANHTVSGKNITVFYTTKASRQYKRSLPFGHLGSKRIGNINLSRPDHEAADACFQFYNDIYYSFGDALRLILTGEACSVAFSDKFALALHREKGIVIYYKTNLVGYVDSDEEPVLVPSKIHLQEQLEEVL